MNDTVLDLFCGAAGGWSLGLHGAGYRTVAAAEADPWRRAVFGRQFPGARLYDDVRAVSAARLRGDLGFLPAVVVGSPPCQDASSANPGGAGLGGERSGLFWEWVRLVSECRPVWAAAENVPGFRTRGVDGLLAALEALGYACWPLVVGAWHAGAPHRRNRVWLVAADLQALQRGALAGSESNRADAGVDDDADVGREHEQPLHGEVAELVGALPADADARAVRQSELPERSKQKAPITPKRGRPWNGGPPPLGDVDDGLPALLGRHRGLGRAALAAFGDAVVPAIPEALGRVMRELLR